MEHYFQWGKETSLDHDMTILDGVVFHAAKRDITYEKVLGVSGEFSVDNGRYEASEITFPVKISKWKKDLRDKTHQISHWLNSQHGFNWLYFSDEPEFYYKASFVGTVDVGVRLNVMAKTEITFKLQPYKYTITGQERTKYRGIQTIVNPYKEKAYPIIRVIGYGNKTLKINDKSYSFKSIDGWIEVNSELGICYDSKGQATEKAQFDIDNFPVLEVGNNEMRIDREQLGTFEVVPNWRELI